MTSLQRGSGPKENSSRLGFPLPLFFLQPVLARIVSQVARDEPSLFNRLGAHKKSCFVIDPVNMPFVLELKPDPDNLSFRALSRRDVAACDAKISGKFMDLLQLIDCDQDGDAMFFSRGLEIAGDTEAVVSLRNALDDVDGSLAEKVANMFGPAGRLALSGLRRLGGYSHAPIG
ncbi:ubiquinone anaerobic biosynthesis accessory factor UbiT [Roseibium sediminis]|uniref:ubiquinone anaerobic biosynthesis accessory factor UbiT n=1 Tax=Roseibium sediminis TaxID=1775174 RepID=UPI00123CEDB8